MSGSAEGLRDQLDTPDDRRLYDAVDQLAQINGRDPREAGALLQAWWRTGATTNAEPDKGVVLAEIVTAGQRGSAFRRNVDPQLVGAPFLGAYVGILLRRTSTSRHAPFSLRTALGVVCGIVIEGLRPEPGPSAHRPRRQGSGSTR